MMVPPLTVQAEPAPAPAEGTEAVLPVELGQTMAAALMAALGAAMTANVAALENPVPQLLVNWARNRLALSLRLAVSWWGDLAAPEFLVRAAPPSPLPCHCTPGVGLPLADPVKETELSSHTVRLVGFEVTSGAEFTVTVALPVPELAQLAL